MGEEASKMKQDPDAFDRRILLVMVAIIFFLGLGITAWGAYNFAILTCNPAMFVVRV